MIAAESRGAWGELEARLRPYVRRRVRSDADADDVLQEIFLRIQAGVAGLRDGERFGGWVYRVAEHAIVDAARAHARGPLAGVIELPEEGEDVAGSDLDTLQSELGQCVALFVARLPSPYREAVTLTELEGLTQKDAAEMLGVSTSGMKSRVQRGRERIREMFEQCCEISLDCRGRVTDCTPRNLEQVPDDCRAAAADWATRQKTALR